MLVKLVSKLPRRVLLEALVKKLYPNQSFINANPGGDMEHIFIHRENTAPTYSKVAYFESEDKTVTLAISPAVSLPRESYLHPEWK